MKKANFCKVEFLSLTLILFVLNGLQLNSQTLCIDSDSDQITGDKDGYRYELWNQNSQGEACMTLGSGALFSGEWSGVENYLARRGLGYNKTQEHQEIGVFSAGYTCKYDPSIASGNSYLSVYGWTVDPLIEYYIVEDWRNWIPSMSSSAIFKGSFTANDGVYDIYENTRVNQPSIIGYATFQQYFSIRKTKRNSGTISISDHFKKWEELGLNMGKMYEVSFVVEGYQSSGSFEFTDLDVTVNANPVEVYAETIPVVITLFPNPNFGKLFVKFSEANLNSTIRIYDATGKAIIIKEHINTDLFQASTLKSGIYFVNIKSARFSYNSKLLVH